MSREVPSLYSSLAVHPASRRWLPSSAVEYIGRWRGRGRPGRRQRTRHYARAPPIHAIERWLLSSPSRELGPRLAHSHARNSLAGLFERARSARPYVNFRPRHRGRPPSADPGVNGTNAVSVDSRPFAKSLLVLRRLMLDFPRWFVRVLHQSVRLKRRSSIVNEIISGIQVNFLDV